MKTPLLLALEALGEPDLRWAPSSDTELQLVAEMVAHRQAQRDDAPFLTRAERAQLESANSPASAGFADLHSHAMSDYGFGRRIVNPGDAPCDGQWHGLRPDLMKLLMNAPELLEDDIVSDLLPHCPTLDVPSFDGWAHEQFLTSDLHYAWSQGMRLMVMYAVNNALLCAMSSDYTRGVRHSCADKPNIEAQLLATWRLEAEESERDGGWLRVAVDALDGARSLAAGKLTVVLGVEASNYFDFPERGGVLDPASRLVIRHQESPACNAQGRDPAIHRFADNELYPSTPWSAQECGYATTALRAATRLGVRAVMPVHEWNSVMGGAAFQHIPLFQPGYSIVTGSGVPESVGVLGIAAQLLYFNTHATQVSGWPMPGEFARDRALGLEYVRNFQGLTPMGRAFLRAAWDAGAIVDVGHYGERSLEEALSWIEGSVRSAGIDDRPMLIDSHVTARSVSLVPLDDLEFAASDTELRRMARYGRIVVGMRTPLSSSRPFTPGQGRAPVENCLMYDNGECVRVLGRKVLAPGDARALAQAYGYMRELPMALAFGADMNGGATQTAPRLCVDVAKKETLEGMGMNVDLSALLVPCHDLNGGVENPSPYLGRGLATVAAQPHVLADLDCLTYAAQKDPRTDAACKAARQRGAMADYCATGTDNPLCSSARWFVQAWADPAFDAPSTGLVGGARGTVEMLGSGGVPTVKKYGVVAPISGKEPVLEHAGERPFPKIRFAGSGGSWVEIDREAERRHVRLVREDGTFGPVCRTLDQRIHDLERKRKGLPPAKDEEK